MDRSVHKREQKHLLTGHIAPTTTATQPPSTAATTETLLSEFDDSIENAIDEAASLLSEAESSKEDSKRASATSANENEEREPQLTIDNAESNSNEFFRYMEDHLPAPAATEKRHSRNLAARFKRWAARFARVAAEAAVDEQPQRVEGASVRTYDEFFARHRV